MDFYKDLKINFPSRNFKGHGIDSFKNKAEAFSAELVSIGAGEDKELYQTAQALNYLITDTIVNNEQAIKDVKRGKEIIDKELKEQKIPLTGNIKDKDPDKESKEAVFAKAQKDKQQLDGLLEKLKESLAQSNEKRKQLTTKVQKLMADKDPNTIRMHNFADSILNPQKKQSIVYLGDLRKPSHSDYEEKRGALDILNKVYDVRDVSISPGAVDAKNRNWYSTLSVWKKLGQEASKSIMGALASKTNKYTARKGEASPSYSAHGSGSIRNELALLHYELENAVTNLENASTEEDKTEYKEIIKEKENLIVTLEGALEKIPKKEGLTKDEKAIIRQLNMKWKDYDSGVAERDVLLKGISKKVNQITGIVQEAKNSGKYLDDDDKKIILNEREELNYLAFRLKYDPAVSSKEIKEIEKEDLVIFGWTNPIRFRLTDSNGDWHYFVPSVMPDTIHAEYMNKDSIQRIISNRHNSKYSEEVNLWINLIEHTLKDNIVIHWTPFDSSINAIRLNGFETIRNETNSVLKDVHYSEKGQLQLSNTLLTLYNSIKKKDII